MCAVYKYRYRHVYVHLGDHHLAVAGPGSCKEPYPGSCADGSSPWESLYPLAQRPTTHQMHHRHATPNLLSEALPMGSGEVESLTAAIHIYSIQT